MEDEEAKISQIKVEETPLNCPVCPPCPVPPKTKPGKAFLKVLFLFLLALVLATIVLVGSGIRIVRKESLLDIWLARNQAPSPTITTESTPTLDPTADWKTYTNAKYQYSIKYPQTFSVTEQSSEYVRLSLGLNQSNQPSSQTYLSIQVKDNPQKLSLQEWEKANVDVANYAPFPKGVTYLENNGIIFQITPVIVDREDTDGSIGKIFDQIRSTFKFVTVTPTSSPSAQTKGGLTQGTPVKIKSTSLTTATGPLVIKGTVDSGWMFEGVMPVWLLDSSRNEIATGSASETTPGSWQSGKAVDFSVSLNFTTKDTSGFLVFKNDNPSGLPENQKIYELPVKFAQR